MSICWLSLSGSLTHCLSCNNISSAQVPVVHGKMTPALSPSSYMDTCDALVLNNAGSLGAWNYWQRGLDLILPVEPQVIGERYPYRFDLQN